MSHPVAITYFDTAMILIEIGSLRLLTDPVFDAIASSFDYGPVHLEKSGDRATTPEALGRIDVVLLSHDQHGDNLDRAGRLFLSTVPLVLTTPLAASRLDGVNAQGLETWHTRTLSSSETTVTVTSVPAQHGPSGTEEATGPVTGFLLEWSGQDSGPVYISGDTVLFTGTTEIAARYAPIGLAILHLGRVELEPMKGKYLSMSAAEALEFARTLQARAIIPIHFEGWKHFSETASAAQAVLATSDLAGRVHWPAAGRRINFPI